MGWFKHSTDAKNDEKIRALGRLLRRPWKVAYAEWFVFLECANKEGDRGRLDLLNGHLNAQRLAHVMETNPRGLQSWLRAGIDIGLLGAEKDGIPVASPVPSGINLLETIVFPDKFTQHAGDYSVRKIRKEEEAKYLQEKGTVTAQSVNGSCTPMGGTRGPIYSSFSSLEENKEEKTKQEKKEEIKKEIERLWRFKYHKKMRFFPADERNLETKIREYDGATVVRAYKEYLRESNDYLEDNRHPFGVFIKQFDFHVVDEVPEPATAKQTPEAEMVEFEGAKIPKYVRETILADRAAAQRKIDEREREEELGRQNIAAIERDGF
jgi:hypothetical protein